jgi:GT2 family glycosyltransferase
VSEGVLSVCVSTFNRAEQLDRLLRALLGQNLTEPFEVVVYDDASTDGTADVLSRWRASQRLQLEVLRGGVNKGPAAGRNTAWRASTGPLVLFTDDDCVPQPGWARAHLAAAGPARVTVGRTRPDPDQVHHTGPFSRSMDVTGAGFFQTCNIAYPRPLLDELDGFHEGFRRAAGEDTDLGLRAVAAGADAVFVEDAVVLHDVRPSDWTAALRECAKWGDIPLFAARHPGTTAEILHSNRWWRASHPPALLAAAGIAGAAWEPWLLLAALPWLRHRTGAGRVEARIRQWPWVLPAQLAVDLAEVLVLARGSLRHRRLLL